MFKIFSKPNLTIEGQLKELANCGVTLTPGIAIDDLFLFHSRQEMEAKPYDLLILSLGFCSEDGEDIPFCQRLWMCDYECIEDDGAYVDLMSRLWRLSDERLNLTSVHDFVKIEENTAWIEFHLGEDTIRWNLALDNDWLDPKLFVNYDRLLAQHTDLRIYSNNTDFGQSALLGCFTKKQFHQFNKLSRVRLTPIGD